MFLHDIDAIKTALSNSAAFRTWTGAATPTAALAYISRFAGEISKDHMCFLSHGDWTCERGDLGTGFYVKPAVVAEFIETCKEDATDEAAIAELLADVGSIAEELVAQTAYPINDIVIGDNTPERTRHSATQDYVSFRIVIFGDEWQDYST